MGRTSCKLKEAFPIDQLSLLDLGNMDGHRDPLIEKGFVVTKSVNTFLQDKHSIIIGSFGAGKSALFNLLRNKSELLETYQNDLIVSIDEQIQFDALKKDADKYFPGLSQQLTFQLLWKFQVCRRISEELAKEKNFPSEDPEEKYISEFIKRTGGLGGHLSILTRIKSLFEEVSLKIKAKLSDIPVDVEISKDAAKAVKRIELNLDEVLLKASRIIAASPARRCTVIIDKLDKFVAGEEYDTQRAYIEALLLLEDDIYAIQNIGFKVFLRSDLYDRLNFSSLGPDKAEDNTLRLIWSKEEIREFIAKRLYVALEDEKIWTFREIMDSSDMKDYGYRWYDTALREEKKSSFKYRCADLYRKVFGKKRNKKALFEKIDLLIISKLFEKNLIHECSNGTKKTIENSEFFNTHFLDGNKSCTPRYILVFLKELIEEANEYYSNSPDVIVYPIFDGGDWVYNLFTEDLVYKSYLQSKEKYIRHVSKVDDRWTRHILELLENKDKRLTFNYKWISENINFENSEVDAVTFLIFLQVIGFLQVKQYHQNVKKRTYELPVLYKSALGAI